MNNIAVLLTCHNRKEKTITCLTSLFEAILPVGFSLDVFLVDDGSTDGTAEAVSKNFPVVNIIQGDGNLFWNQGMRLAWEAAANHQAYDFYLWLNDDTLLDKNAIIELLATYSVALKVDQSESIITGACRKSETENEFSYGGRTEICPVIPNGELQACKYINGNAVLVPKNIYNKIGIHSSDYTHGMGDFDYGLRALQAGFNCYTTKEYIAICPPNEGIPAWCNPKTPLMKRLQLLYSPLGLNLKEYNTFRKKFWGWKWMIFAGKAYAKALSPSIYQIISK
ncbi:glycosyltransferase family 2 protein [Labilibaculum sp.]|uniref:glycosyltransferase family 2 protein n=1 Tax=Labilibaculum sp. TaxID=2060723 RepID=UPI003567D669